MIFQSPSPKIFNLLPCFSYSVGTARLRIHLVQPALISAVVIDIVRKNVLRLYYSPVGLLHHFAEFFRIYACRVRDKDNLIIFLFTFYYLRLAITDAANHTLPVIATILLASLSA